MVPERGVDTGDRDDRVARRARSIRVACGCAGAAAAPAGSAGCRRASKRRGAARGRRPRRIGRVPLADSAQGDTHPSLGLTPRGEAVVVLISADAFRRLTEQPRTHFVQAVREVRARYEIDGSESDPDALFPRDPSPGRHGAPRDIRRSDRHCRARLARAVVRLHALAGRTAPRLHHRLPGNDLRRASDLGVRPPRS